MGDHLCEQHNLAKIPRRTVLQGVFAGAAAGAAAGATPVVAAAIEEPAPAEPLLEKIDRLSSELSEALNSYLGGTFFAEIYPSEHSDRPVRFGSINAVKRAAEDLSDEQQVEACAEQLKAVLGRMCPKVYDLRHGLQVHEDGSVYFAVVGFIQYEEYSGPGLYEVSQLGYVGTYWLEKVPYRRKFDGKVMPGHWRYVAMQWADGEFIGEAVEWSSVNIVRKISDGLLV